MTPDINESKATLGADGWSKRREARGSEGTLGEGTGPIMGAPVQPGQRESKPSRLVGGRHNPVPNSNDLKNAAIGLTAMAYGKFCGRIGFRPRPVNFDVFRNQTAYFSIQH